MYKTDLLQRLKKEGQDFEWYPTTKKMLGVVAEDLKMEIGQNSFSLLDIGAGDGNALNTIENLMGFTEYEHVQKYAIERSKILIDQLPAEIFVVGTDFHQQTLIDKRVDVIFCNPPYSEYEAWMEKIVREANCKYLYMVIPERWSDNKAVTSVIKRRTEYREKADPGWDERIKYYFEMEKGKCEVLDSFTFEDSEYRSARAKVQIIKIKFKGGSGRNSLKVDPFDLWFENNFQINADTSSDSEHEWKQRKSDEIRGGLVKGQNLIERLEELYREDFDRLLSIYKTLETMDYSLFKELGVDLQSVREGLKSKIKGLKDLYWKELFDNLDSITSRLTSSSRKKLLGTLTSHTSIDFTAANAYAVVIWAIKNANIYFDKQLIEIYFELSDKENIRNYKSNKHFIDDSWRYIRGEHSHYTLDYRLVLQRWNVFTAETWRDHDYPNGLYTDVHNLLNDIITVARNLGFEITANSMDYQWAPGEKKEFLGGGGEVFMEVRAYKKGTVHLKLDQRFMRKLNIEAGRLNGWVRSAGEAADELEIPIEEVQEHFGGNYQLLSSSVKLLADWSEL